MAVMLCGFFVVWSCSDTEAIMPQSRPISFKSQDVPFSGGAVTRLTANGNTTSFDPGKDIIGIYADYLPEGDKTRKSVFMSNQKVEYIQDNNLNGGKPFWQYSPIKYWPAATGDRIDFYAYYPYTGNGITINLNNEGLPSLNYTNDSFTDFMLAKAKDKTSADAEGAVSLNFMHALGKLQFAFKIESSDATNFGVKNIRFTPTNNTTSFSYRLQREGVEEWEINVTQSDSFTRTTWNIIYEQEPYIIDDLTCYLAVGTTIDRITLTIDDDAPIECVLKNAEGIPTPVTITSNTLTTITFSVKAEGNLFIIDAIPTWDEGGSYTGDLK